jgi:hypothetical protein
MSKSSLLLCPFLFLVMKKVENDEDRFVSLARFARSHLNELDVLGLREDHSRQLRERNHGMIGVLVALLLHQRWIAVVNRPLHT